METEEILLQDLCIQDLWDPRSCCLILLMYLDTLLKQPWSLCSFGLGGSVCEHHFAFRNTTYMTKIKTSKYIHHLILSNYNTVVFFFLLPFFSSLMLPRTLHYQLPVAFISRHPSSSFSSSMVDLLQSCLEGPEPLSNFCSTFTPLGIESVEVVLGGSEGREISAGGLCSPERFPVAQSPLRRSLVTTDALHSFSVNTVNDFHLVTWLCQSDLDLPQQPWGWIEIPRVVDLCHFLWLDHPYVPNTLLGMVFVPEKTSNSCN